MNKMYNVYFGLESPRMCKGQFTVQGSIDNYTNASFLSLSSPVNSSKGNHATQFCHQVRTVPKLLIWSISAHYSSFYSESRKVTEQNMESTYNRDSYHTVRSNRLKADRSKSDIFYLRRFTTVQRKDLPSHNGQQDIVLLSWSVTSTDATFKVVLFSKQC